MLASTKTSPEITSLVWQTRLLDMLQLSTFGLSLTKFDSPCGKILYIVKTVRHIRLPLYAQTPRDLHGLRLSARIKHPIEKSSIHQKNPG